MDSNNFPKLYVDLSAKKFVVIFATVFVFLFVPIYAYQSSGYTQEDLREEVVALFTGKPRYSQSIQIVNEASNDSTGNVAGVQDSIKLELPKVFELDQYSEYTILAIGFIFISLLLLVLLIKDHKHYKKVSKDDY